ncbi:MAG: hypothetical protein KAR56_03170 [Thermoplasmata archaeon]|nr:hypothetical protein [Thermoplasmata archaeon]
MRKPYPHRQKIIIQPSFPNNKLSSRPRKKKVEKRETIDYSFTPQFRLPAKATFTPYDQPNPTDESPKFSQTMNYSDAGNYSPASPELLRACEQGDGCEPAQELLGGGCVQHGGVLFSAQPISGTEIGHTCGIDDSQGVRVCGDFGEIPQVASLCNWRAPLITSSDGDGIRDDDEDCGPGAFNNNGAWEPGQSETDPSNPDTDGDGLWDGWVDVDSSLSFGGTDRPGEGYGGQGYIGISATNPLDIDSDNDGLIDGHSMTINGIRYLGEAVFGSDPLHQDTDRDRIKDDIEPRVLYRTDALEYSDFNTSYVEVDLDWSNYNYDELERFQGQGTDSYGSLISNDVTRVSFFDGSCF